MPRMIASTATEGRMISLSETSARILAGVLDSIAMAGSQAKLQAGFAQGELERALAALNAPKEPEAAPDAAASS